MKFNLVNYNRLRIRSFVFLLSLGLSVSLNVSALSQKQKVTLSLNEASVEEMIKQISEQTGLKFIYSSEMLKNKANVSINVKQKTVQDVLNSTLSSRELAYEYLDGAIVVKKSNAAQQEKLVITGVVKDKKGAVIPGVTILLKGTALGIATDENGKYTLTIPTPNLEKQLLVFSFIGMKTQEIVIGDKKVINVVMEEEQSEMDEVVVTGYFDRSKKSFTGAVKQVKREELRKFGNVNLLQALKMVDPSFKMKENNEMGSDPNTLPEFFVRGEGSFMGSNLPTFIVDGYEVSLQYVFDMDLDRIESLNILKDASATIHYGSRAANGVVVIETRRPEAGELQVSYANRTSLSVADLTAYDLMDAQEKLNYEIAAGLFESNTLIGQVNSNKVLEHIKTNIAKGVNTDWLAQPVRNGVSHSHSLNISGGDRAITYNLGANYSKNSGVIKKSSRENYGLNFNLIYRIRDKVNISNSFSYTQTNVQNSPYGSFSEYAAANPYNPIYDEDGNFVRTYPQHLDNKSYGTEYQNPLYNARLKYKDESSSSSIINNLNIDMNIIPDLRFKFSLALSKSNTQSDKYISPNHTMYANAKDDDLKGSYTQNFSKIFSYNINTTLNYALHFGDNQLYAGVGLNIVDNNRSSTGLTGIGYSDEKFDEIGFASSYVGGKPTGSKDKDRMIGFLGNINYSYANKYFVDFSARIDGSSKYGKDKRFAPLWSVGVGWNINNEAFMESVTWLDRLTLRASIGTTGSQNFDSNIAKTELMYSDKTYNGALGATFISYGNEKLEWQQSLKKNIGFNMDIVEHRLSLSFDYYNDKTTGLLLPITVAPSLGFDSYTENFGEQLNEGWEFDINAVIIRTNDWDWAVNFSGSHNKNKITKISNALSSLNEKNNSNSANFTKPISMYEEGESLNAIKVVRSMGINPANGKEIFLDRNGNITYTWDYRDKVRMGDSQPTLEGNIGTNLVWKEFSLNVLFRYSFGAQTYNSTLANRVEGASPYKNADKRVFNERWQSPDDYSFYKDVRSRTIANASSRFVQDNDFLELSNLSLSYRVKPELLKKIGVSSLRIALNTNNLFHISSVKRERGLDYPFAQQYTFSLNLNF